MIFSIIVPVYNIETYIECCINSLISQDFEEYEILLIDDGSTDNSGLICDEYSLKYDKIKVFHKLNGGLSDARNFGISKSTGEYLIFVDGDDRIAPDTLLGISKKIQSKPDFVETRLVEDYGDITEEKDIKMAEYFAAGVDKKTVLAWEMIESQNTWPAVKKIVSKKFIESNNLQFLKGYLHEDLDWTCSLYKHAEKIEIYTDNWYYHRMNRKGSITNNINAKNIIDVIEMATLFYNYYINNVNEENTLIMNRIMVSVYVSLNQIKRVSKEQWDDIERCIKKNIMIFSISPKFKYKVFVMFMKVFGVAFAMRLLSV